MAEDSKNKATPKDMQELSFVGDSRLTAPFIGLNRFGFFHSFNPDTLVGRKGMRVYDRMLLDDQIKAIQTMKKNAVLQTGWEIVPASDDPLDRKIAENMEWNFHIMQGTLDDRLREVMSSNDYGFSISELIWNVIDHGDFKGKIGLKDIKSRRPHSWLFHIDEHGNVLGIKQQFLINQTEDHLPVEKFIIDVNDKKFGNMYGQSELRSAYRCYSDDTEVLTKAGWKLFKDVLKDDVVATLNPKTEELEYHKYSNKYEYDYSGKMFCQKGRFIDLKVTPKHKMWICKGNSPKFAFVDAENVPKIVRYKRNAEWRGQERGFFTLAEMEYSQWNKKANREVTNKLPEIKIPMDNWLQLLGIWLAEGSTYWKTKKGIGRYSVVIYQVKQENLKIIKEWVTKCGFNFSVKRKEGKEVGIEIVSKQLCDYLRNFGTQPYRFIPEEIKELSSRQLNILYLAMALGDGTHGGREYATSSKILADDVQEILLKDGYASVIRKEEPKKDYYHTMWIVSRNTRNISRTVCNEHRDQREWVDYVGKIYCMEVPNHLLYVRRNGKSCWCGNSFWAKENLMLWWNIYGERHAIPLAVGTYSRDNQITSPSHQEELKSIINVIQSKMSVLLPPGVNIEFKDVAKGGEKFFVASISFHDQAMSKALLLPQLLGMSTQTQQGSFAQAKTQFNVFMLTIKRMQKQIEETVMLEQVIKRLVDFNYLVDVYPQFKFLPTTKEDRLEIAKTWVESLKGQAVVSGIDDENKLRQLLEFDEREETEEEKAGIIPVVNTPKKDNDFLEELKSGLFKLKLFRQPNDIEGKVDFARVEKNLDKLELKFTEPLVIIFEKQKAKLLDLIKRKVDKGLLDMRFINKELNLKFKQDIVRTLKEFMRSGYGLGQEDAGREVGGTQLAIDPILPEAAIRFLEDKSFWISGLMNDDILNDVRSVLVEGLKTGASFKGMEAGINDVYKPFIGDSTAITKAGVTSPFRVETVIRTNLSDAYNQGRLAMGADPALEDFIVGWEYSEILDSRTVPISIFADGKKIKKEDPDLPKLSYPLHFNDRGLFVPVTTDDLPVVWITASQKSRLKNMMGKFK